MLLSFTRTGALPLGKVGERLQVHRTSVTNIVDKLEAGGRAKLSPRGSSTGSCGGCRTRATGARRWPRSRPRVAPPPSGRP